MTTQDLRRIAAAAVAWLVAGPWAGAALADADLQQIARGHDLFLRVWQSNPPPALGADGLGPVFNAASCVACHNQAGVGGGGGRDANVKVLTVSEVTSRARRVQIHPGLADQTSVVLHHSGSDRLYAAWQKQRVKMAKQRDPSAEEAPTLNSPADSYQQGMQRQAAALANINASFGIYFEPEPQNALPTIASGRAATAGQRARSAPPGTVTLSERNSIALFGDGLIDQIPDAAIELVAQEQRAQAPLMAGRIARLADRRIGRFGWHAQQASLADFTLTACAVELGLNVPDHPQAGDPLKPKQQAGALDMNADQCAELVAFVASLPRPVENAAPNGQVQRGRQVFDLVGCAICHRPDLGPVLGLYSDLLLHDMGAALAGEEYGAFIVTREVPRPAKRPRQGSSQWRTPPLWGVAATAPYLHDGRADNLQAAITLHGGQAAEAVDQFRNLPPQDRQSLLDFLESLIAPPNAEKMPAIGGHWGAVANPRRAKAGREQQDQAGQNLFRFDF